MDESSCEDDAGSALQSWCRGGTHLLRLGMHTPVNLLTRMEKIVASLRGRTSDLSRTRRWTVGVGERNSGRE